MLRYLDAIFCDDIREERGGKLSLVGTYHTKMLVDSFPITLRQLFVRMKAVTSGDYPIKSLRFEILVGDNVIENMEISDAELAQFPASLDKNKENKQADYRHVVVSIIELNDITIDVDTQVRTRIITEDGVIYGDKLKIVKRNLQTTAAINAN